MNTEPSCSYEGCEIYEVLPFTCEYCKKEFCMKHRFPENHDCEVFMNLEKRKFKKNI
ncbi:MAG: AN1-type zinc finger domain-containing protein [Candidatus Heimdallarchaeota archaeon]|nr:AN1-type zinc finger domain-containing protein [Candidatus Heimdallarchaeota archaeon]MCK5049273.1 AN1-type zinc finger domain-containing protein [Candidatus Heimdallarchaeota archaeon]